MRLNSLCITALLSLTLPGFLLAQSTPPPADVPPPQLPPPPVNSNPNPPWPPAALSPFSRFAIGGGISDMGINLQGAVNINRYLNLRGVGNIFQYTRNNISVSGFTATGKVNFASAGASLDVYPWPNHGFRVSPGLLFFNQNEVTGNLVAAGGTSFTLSDTTYYSSQSNPVTGVGSVDLHARNPAPTITVGWGNMIPRRGGQWSFPFELGAAMIGDPVPNIAFTSGQVCSDPQGKTNCQNVVGDPTLNANLQAQLAKYKSDLQPLRFYPILSVGVGYSFKIR